MGQSTKKMDKYRVGREEYRIKVSDHILDNIYGRIGLTELERRIERLPVFKRLHNVSQLGLVNWVFPCALHTRYTHSIGVMHVAGQMADHINRNTGMQFFDDTDIQIIRLAGLLHDIGHYPLSHNVEQAYKDADKRRGFAKEDAASGLRHYINCPDFLNPLWQEEAKPDAMTEGTWEEVKCKRERERFLEGFSGSDEMHHEHIGALLIASNKEIRDIIVDNLILLTEGDQTVLNPKFAPVCNGETVQEVTHEEVERIARKLMVMISQMVRGNYAYDEYNLPWTERYSAMIQIIHSELDADNLDYLIRDATFSGTSYGTMDMGMLLNSLTVAKFVLKDNSTMQGGEADKRQISRYIVGVRQKGLGSVEQFLLNKFLAYTQMILSKYVSILEAMLLRLESDHIIPAEDVYTCEEIMREAAKERTSGKYLKFSDHYIYQRIMELDKSVSTMRELPRAIVSCLANYSAFNLQGDDDECLCTGFSDKEIKEEVERSSVYKAFKEMCTGIKNLEGKAILEDPVKSKQLFSFRFERFSLTKQLPLKQFLDKYQISEEISSKQFDFHYFRLGNGIPVISSGREYVYDPSEQQNTPGSGVPLLCVDCTQSSLHKLFPMEYLSLRRYKVDQYEAC